MIVLVTGSRVGFTYKQFKDFFEKSTEGKVISEVVVGCARGIDYYARKYCKQNNIKLNLFEADWNNLGKNAGSKRNEDMGNYLVEKRDGGEDCLVVACRFNMSVGTTHMIRFSMKNRLKCLILDQESVDFDFT